MKTSFCTVIYAFDSKSAELALLRSKKESVISSVGFSNSHLVIGEYLPMLSLPVIGSLSLSLQHLQAMSSVSYPQGPLEFYMPINLLIPYLSRLYTLSSKQTDSVCTAHKNISSNCASATRIPRSALSPALVPGSGRAVQINPLTAPLIPRFPPPTPCPTDS